MDTITWASTTTVPGHITLDVSHDVARLTFTADSSLVAALRAAHLSIGIVERLAASALADNLVGTFTATHTTEGATLTGLRYTNAEDTPVTADLAAAITTRMLRIIASHPHPDIALSSVALDLDPSQTHAVISATWNGQGFDINYAGPFDILAALRSVIDRADFDADTELDQIRKDGCHVVIASLRLAGDDNGTWLEPHPIIPATIANETVVALGAKVTDFALSSGIMGRREN